MSDEAHFAGKLVPDKTFEEQCRMEFISSIFADIVFHLKQFWYQISYSSKKKKKTLELSEQGKDLNWSMTKIRKKRI